MVMNKDEMLRQFDAQGRLWLRKALSRQELLHYENLSSLGDHPGERVAADDMLFQAISAAGFTQRLARLWPGVRPVRLLSFDKKAGSNWGVPWHQDRVIAVNQKIDLPGYDNWSCKSGVWHCEPPLDILNTMLFVRVHLDHNTRDNGAMEIALGSHHAGRCQAKTAAQQAARYKAEITEAEPGDVLILKMLTLHRSLPATGQSTRRVLRVDMAANLLPPPLDWAV